MKNKQHILAVFIGRFQPFHIGHHAVIASVANRVDSMLVLVGSAFRPRSWKNPFTYQERRGFLLEGVGDIEVPIETLPLIDTLYNDRAWATNVRLAVGLHMQAKRLDPATTAIALTGFEKDKSSQYLSWFPEWEMMPASPHLHNGQIISATQMRDMLFFGHDARALRSRFGENQVATVQRWMADHPQEVARIRAEAGYIKAYSQRIEAAEKVFGYPISVNTVDAVVVQSGHVLMVQRKALPGKGLWALPGGHIDRGESGKTAILRELYEETGLDMSRGAFATCLHKRQVFDHPARSEKGWVRTEAFVFELQDRGRLEQVKGGSDAAIARWVPLTDITPDTIFEDHFDIIQALVPDLPYAYSSILMAHATG